MKQVKRSKLQIYYKVINLLSLNGGMKKTHILYKANLAHNGLEDIIKVLSEHNIIIFREQKVFLTNKGIELNNDLREVFRSIKNVNEVYKLDL